MPVRLVKEGIYAVGAKALEELADEILKRHKEEKNIDEE